MKYEVRDPFAKSLGVEVVEWTQTTLETRTTVDESVCNIYLSAHGGFVYAVGHITAALAAQACLNRSAVVVDVTSQYLCALRGPDARTTARLIRAGRELMVFSVEIRDARGALCCAQTVTLKAVDYPETKVAQIQPTFISAGEDAPPDPVTGARFPRPCMHFGHRCHVYNLGPSQDGMRYGVELYPDICNLYGGLHGGAMYTMCDLVVGGSATFLLQKRPVTVSSGIHYLRSARVGPVFAQSHLLRAGKQLLFYTVEVTDGDGSPVAVAEFVLQSVAFEARLDADNGLGYQSKVF